MSESIMAAEFEAIAMRAAGITQAYSQARSLEAQATTLRKDSIEAQAVAFETANERLIENFNLGVFSSSQAVRVIAELNDLDPEIVKLYGHKRGERVISAFDSLKIGAPILGHRSGIVTGQAEVIDISARKKSRSISYHQPFMAPQGKISIPLRTKGRDGEIEDAALDIDIMSLNPVHIGRTAIKTMVQQARFRVGTDSTVCHPVTTNNSFGLSELKANINELYELGMRPINTLPLELELIKARAYSSRRTSMPRQYGRRARR